MPLRLPSVLFAIGLIISLGGCVTVAHQFGGQKKQVDAEAAMKERFPVGTPIEDVRKAMIGYGYTCGYFPPAGTLSGGLNCGDARPRQRGMTVLVGGFWSFAF